MLTASIRNERKPLLFKARPIVGLAIQHKKNFVFRVILKDPSAKMFCIVVRFVHPVH